MAVLKSGPDEATLIGMSSSDTDEREHTTHVRFDKKGGQQALQTPPPPPLPTDIFEIPRDRMHVIETLRRKYGKKLMQEGVDGERVYDTICKYELTNALCESPDGRVSMSALRDRIISQYHFVCNADLVSAQRVVCDWRDGRQDKLTTKEVVAISDEISVSENGRVRIKSECGYYENLLGFQYRAAEERISRVVPDENVTNRDWYERFIIEVYGTRGAVTKEAMAQKARGEFDHFDEVAFMQAIEIVQLRYSVLIFKALENSERGCSRDELRQAIQSEFRTVNEFMFNTVYDEVWKMLYPLRD